MTAVSAGSNPSVSTVSNASAPPSTTVHADVTDARGCVASRSYSRYPRSDATISPSISGGSGWLSCATRYRTPRSCTSSADGIWMTAAL
jgi:hypothetical protein